MPVSAPNPGRLAEQKRVIECGDDIGSGTVDLDARKVLAYETRQRQGLGPKAQRPGDQNLMLIDERRQDRLSTSAGFGP